MGKCVACNGMKGDLDRPRVPGHFTRVSTGSEPCWDPRGWKFHWSSETCFQGFWARQGCQGLWDALEFSDGSLPRF